MKYQREVIGQSGTEDRIQDYIRRIEGARLYQRGMRYA